MKRLAFVLLVLVFVLGCNKPSEDNCRKALVNMQHLLGTENMTETANLDGEVRRCRGGSTKESVECAINATTLDQLRQCGFTHLPERKK
jgi:hypothetical protein